MVTTIQNVEKKKNLTLKITHTFSKVRKILTFIKLKSLIKQSLIYLSEGTCQGLMWSPDNDYIV